MTKNEKVSFAEIVKKTYESIKKNIPEFASDFHFSKKGKIILDNVAIVGVKKCKNVTQYVFHYNDCFIDFCKSGKIDFYLWFGNSGNKIPINDNIQMKGLAVNQKRKNKKVSK